MISMGCEDEKSECEQFRSKDTDNQQELLVFGYSCKLFRDDFTAKAIDRGQHLIPWNDDESLLVDRYDCRGNLMDLNAWDADKLAENASALTEDELAIEHLCNEERYLSLRPARDDSDLTDSACDLSNRGRHACIPYDYGNDGDESEKLKPVAEDLEPFYPSEKLKLPYGMEVPETAKMNAVIEKTAKFVAEQGLQMEILLKTKQDNKPQFDFLKYDNYLHPYYKHLVSMIKSKRYMPGDGNKTNGINCDVVDEGESSQSDNDSETYLHPLLSGSKPKKQEQQQQEEEDEQQVENKIPLPSRSADFTNTPYGKLIKSLCSIQQREDMKREAEEQLLAKINKKNEDLAIGESKLPIPGSDIVPPPPDVLPIIDKLADYVARNGKVFEDSVRKKMDTRFSFLDEDHVHHKYYKFKKNHCEELAKQKLEEKKRKEMEDRRRIHGSGIKFLIKSKPPENPVITPNRRVTPSIGTGDDEESISDLEFDYIEGKNGGTPEVFTGIGPQGPSKETLEKMKLDKQEADRKKNKLLTATRSILAQESKQKCEERRKKAEIFLKKLKESRDGIGDMSIGADLPPASMLEKLISVDQKTKERSKRSDEDSEKTLMISSDRKDRKHKKSKKNERRRKSPEDNQPESSSRKARDSSRRKHSSRRSELKRKSKSPDRARHSKSKRSKRHRSRSRRGRGAVDE